MPPTPSKTPHKKPVPFATARFTHYETLLPEERMPSQREVKHHKSRRHLSGHDFDIHDENSQNDKAFDIPIYTDNGPREPFLPDAMTDPFAKMPMPDPSKAESSEAPRRSKRIQKSAEQIEDEKRMQEAVDRGEGLIYIL